MTTRQLNLRNFPTEALRRLEEIGARSSSGHRSAASHGLEAALRIALDRRRLSPPELPVPALAVSIDAELLRAVRKVLQPGESASSFARDAARLV